MQRHVSVVHVVMGWSWVSLSTLLPGPTSADPSLRGWVHSDCRKMTKTLDGRGPFDTLDVETKSRSRPSDSRLRLTGTIVALAGARAELKFRSENSNAFSHGDQKMSTSEAPPEAGRRTPATQLQLSN